jgi:hypothetical protein
LGLINEQIRYKQRFFVPADETKAVPLLKKLLARYPVVAGHSDEVDALAQERLSVEIPASEVVVVELEQWVHPPEKAVSQDVIEPSSDPPQQVHMTEGPSLMALLEQRESIPIRSRQPRTVVEEQGLLFGLSE